ncbi:hypothetical protein C0J52_17370 [Blattella germanica]|nr:hypothetical protein C0J52_17370 [Blattella germanica]
MIQQNMSDSFLEHLIRKRTEVTEKRQVKRRVNVTPGKSISVLDVQSSSHTNIPAQPKADTSTLKKPGRKFVATETETSDESDVSVVGYMQSPMTAGKKSLSQKSCIRLKSHLSGKKIKSLEAMLL